MVHNIGMVTTYNHAPGEFTDNSIQNQVAGVKVFEYKKKRNVTRE